jgi:hypothetical protein
MICPVTGGGTASIAYLPTVVLARISISVYIHALHQFEEMYSLH